MKKALALIACFLFIAIIVKAQNKSSGSFLELSVGPSFPIGKFAAKSSDNSEVAGFAKTGLGAQLSYAYKLNRSVGLMLVSGYTVNPVNKKAYKSNLEGAITGLKVNHIDAESWKAVKIMAGGFVVTPLTDGAELVLRTKLLAGVNKTAIAKVTWDGTMPYGAYGQVSTSGDSEHSALPWSFCYQVSMTLDYKLTRKLHLLLDVNSFNSTAKKTFHYTVYSVSPTPPPVVTPVEEITANNKYKQASVNVLAGIGFSF